MWMIVMVMATTASLNAILFRPDSPNVIWPDKAACDIVREAHLNKHPTPDNSGLVCLQVPDHIAKKFLPSKEESGIDT